MISHEHKFLFIHVPRTSGSSIEIQFKYNDAGMWMVNYDGRKHWTLNQWKEHLEPEVFETYFKFTIVRNPWDRVISKYCTRNEFGPIGQPAGKSLKYFLDNYKTPGNEHGETLIDYFDPEQMDYIGRFESREDTLTYVSQKIGVEIDNSYKLRPVQATIKQQNDNHHYTEYYDEETKQIVAERYARDIELFGYEFGD